MPVYSYRTPNGSLIELTMTVAEMTRRQKPDGTLEHIIDGQVVTLTRDMVADMKTTGVPPTSGWPIYSDGAAVHPSQIAEAKEHARARGVPTDFLPDGRPEFRSREHQHRYLKSIGMHNKDDYR